jgi:hypothetical protein
MATFEESIDVGPPVHVTKHDPRISCFRRAMGQYAAPDAGIEWNHSDEALLHREFEFEPTGGGGRLKAKVTYNAARRND